MKKGLLRLLALSLVVMLSLGFLNLPSALAEKTMKVAHNQQPSHPVHVALLSFKEEVEAKTNKSVIVDIYPSAQIADDMTAPEQIMLGSLEGAIIMGAPSTLFQGTDNPLGYIEELPFLFSSAEDARAAYDGALGEAYRAALKDFGIDILCYWENGFRNFTNNVRPIVTPEDMQGIKFRIANSDMRRKTFDALNASAIPMAFAELFTALQQGTVQGQENPLSIITSSKFYEVQKYLSLSRHIYNSATFIVNPDFISSLTSEEQKIVQEAAFTARDYMRQLNDEFEVASIEQLKGLGMEVNNIDYDAFVAKVQPVWDEFISKYGSDLIDLAKNPN